MRSGCLDLSANQRALIARSEATKQSKRAAAPGLPRCARSDDPILIAGLHASRQHQIIAMYHFRTAAEAKNRENVGGGFSRNLRRIVRVISRQPAGDLHTVRSTHGDRIAAVEC